MSEELALLMIQHLKLIEALLTAIGIFTFVDMIRKIYS